MRLQALKVQKKLTQALSRMDLIYASIIFYHNLFCPSRLILRKPIYNRRARILATEKRLIQMRDVHNYRLVFSNLYLPSTISPSVIILVCVNEMYISDASWYRPQMREPAKSCTSHLNIADAVRYFRSSEIDALLLHFLYMKDSNLLEDTESKLILYH